MASRASLQMELATLAPELRADFVFFLECVWQELDLRRRSKGQDIGPVEAHIAHYIAYGCLRPDEHEGVFPIDDPDKSRKRGVLAPRGVGKTTIVAIYVCWRLFIDPQKRVKVLSKSSEMAQKFVGLIRSLLDQVWFLRHLSPKTTKKARKIDNALGFDVRGAVRGKDRSVSAVGMEGHKHGGRGHIIVADDIETPENSNSVVSQRRLWAQTAELINMHYPSDDTCETIVVGTYEAPDPTESVYTRLAREKGYALVTVPILYPQPDESVLNLHPYLADRLASGQSHPGDRVFTWMSERAVQIRRDEGPTVWAKEHMLLCQLRAADRHPLLLRDLIVPTFALDRLKAPIDIRWGTVRHDGSPTAREDIPFLGMTGDAILCESYSSPILEPYARNIAWLDPAGGGVDRTALGIAGSLHSRVFVRYLSHIGVASQAAGSPEILAQIATTLREHAVNACFVECAMAYEPEHDPLAQLLQQACNRLATPAWTCAVTARKDFRGRRKLHKEKHIIQVLREVFAAHRVVVDASVLTPSETKQYTLQHQITTITEMKGCLAHDDLVEVLATLCWELSDQMTTDPDLAAEQVVQDHTLESLINARFYERPQPPDAYRQKTTYDRLPSFHARR